MCSCSEPPDGDASRNPAGIPARLGPWVNGALLTLRNYVDVEMSE